MQAGKFKWNVFIFNMKWKRNGESMCKNGFYENKFLLAFNCEGKHGYMHVCAYVYVHTYLLSTT